MGLRGAERVPRPGGARLQRARRHRGARSHRPPIFTKAPPPPTHSFYPHGRRLRALFAAALAKPVPPSVVGDVVRDIVDGDSWQLRYLVGPDTELRLKARQSKTDEQVIAEAAQSDEEFLARIKRESGLDLVL